MDQHGQTAQKLKLVKNVQNRSKMIFCELKAKKIFCNKNFLQSFPETLQNTLILQRNKQYDQTTQKPKIGLKVENTENKFESKHCYNHSNLAHKRPKRSNRTKNETRVNTSKTATKC